MQQRMHSATDIYGNRWRIEIGEPTGDIYCPHGHAVEIVNRRNYALNYVDDSARVTREMLKAWLNRHRYELRQYCLAHAPACEDCGAYRGESCAPYCSSAFTVGGAS